MPINLPLILIHPNKIDFSLNDNEVEYFKDAKKNMLRKYYNLTIKSVWNAVISNLKRRIEIFGTYDFMNSLDEEDSNIYFRNSYSQSEKLSLLNPSVMINTSFELNIISEKTFYILNLFYWFTKNNSNEPINYEDVISMITLLEKNFFKYKVDYSPPQKEKPIFNKKPTIKKEQVSEINSTQKRRKSDFDNTQTSKKVKKEDLYIMQHAYETPKRRKEDFINSHQEHSFKRRKDDWNNETPKRRKEDWNKAEQPTPRRRKSDWLNQAPKRRKSDYQNSNEQTPRRRKSDWANHSPKRRIDD